MIPRGSLAAAFLILPFLLGCAQQKVVSPPPAPTPQAQAADETNFDFVAVEVVESPEEDTVALVKVYVDGELVGQTQAGPRSSERRWRGALKAGNRLMRFETWALGPSGEPERAADDFQPRERFVRVEDGARTKVSLKFFDKGRQNTFQVSREPLR